jgi:NAD(P)-dependent dehydrogenase (short-subunit alcohol dehydrogenase family)
MSSAEVLTRPQRFADRVAVVTGGAGSIGRGIVELLLDEGCAVAVVDNDADRLSSIESDLNVFGLLADVRDAPATAFDEITAALGEPDVVVNSAGVIPSITWADTTETIWDETISVNLTAAFRWTAEACARWIDRRDGVVVHVVSVESVVAFPQQVAYAASKAGLAGMIRGFAVDLGSSGIRVCGVGPGTVPNGRRHRSAEEWERAAQDIPIGRLGRPEDIGAAVAFLASDDASWVTGEILYVDGGYLAK